VPGETERNETNSRIWRAEQALKTAKRFRDYDASDVAAILTETARLLGIGQSDVAAIRAEIARLMAAPSRREPDDPGAHGDDR